MRRGAAIQPPRWTGLASLPALPEFGPIAPWVILAATVTIFFSASIGLLLGSGDRIVPGVRVMGLDLGGRSPAEARYLVESEAATLLQRPVTLKATGREWQMPAEQLGVNLDSDMVVDDAFAVGHGGNLVQRIFSRWGALLLGSRLAEPLLQVNADQMETELQAIADEIDRPMQDARIDLIPAGDDYSVVVVAEQSGFRISLEDTSARIPRPPSRRR